MSKKTRVLFITIIGCFLAANINSAFLGAKIASPTSNAPDSTANIWFSPHTKDSLGDSPEPSFQPIYHINLNDHQRSLQERQTE